MKSNRDKANKALIEYMKHNRDLDKIAADMLLFAVSQGYCDVTGHNLLWSLMEPFICPCCAKFHNLKDCRTIGAEEYRMLGKEAFQKKYNI